MGEAQPVRATIYIQINDGVFNKLHEMEITSDDSWPVTDEEREAGKTGTTTHKVRREDVVEALRQAAWSVAEAV